MEQSNSQLIQTPLLTAIIYSLLKRFYLKTLGSELL